MAVNKGGGATGKQARGAAGRSNAKHKPWRLNGGGLYPLYMRRIMATLGQDTVRGIGRPPGEGRR